ncbi:MULTISPECIES: YggS family pyridoxal phosphate-dependent enzyme [unclassified Cryobacterium]|uniref:YggS family pyridoxal phosphate-dependent enzyme n=1 Tax=unclassified Cryobacterium TaxID=2649013 RepID=UPI00106BADA5|nr:MULTISPECIES: YggS family pyridoxal phosphate-dependent enzyme [unclassified Cryobacterium]TFC53431.1 YggS family pyridoxal phosphate-dependent enzyme [Cryobacterium sp. TMB3-1-2]TFC59131.1 YggS family pyridoxal phosphate-dependent enzyme [Cryobacterium sp. TMB1-7]TFC69096.1 YggS family pyridoxal phosphate-dependent enzyme [Cryobacterium sp. TMB3-15]TFC76104.1 YggS family pyridoxal phosphate-dependent enzyme [Cryobacterium sp. TMB3-10]TFD43891.1 YggS family pyridoxal phosphate-dependent enz
MSEPDLAQRLANVRGGIADAARLAGRSVDDITTVVVTKFQPVSLIRELLELGVRDLGESRHQEAQAKAAELAGAGIRWHFVGQVQGKKARQVRAYSSVIHSVDRESLVTGLATPVAEHTGALEAGAEVDCFVQVNLTEDPARGGVSIPDLAPLVERVLSAPGLRLLGLMAVAPLGAEPKRSFALVSELGAQMRGIAPDARYLSMGMSQDYAAAIAEGATHLRIGTAITGNRPAAVNLKTS